MLRTTITLLSLALLWPLSGQSFLDEVSVTEGPLVKNKYKEAFVVPHGLGSSGASYFYVARPGNQYMFRFGESPVGTSLGRISPDNRNFR